MYNISVNLVNILKVLVAILSVIATLTFTLSVYRVSPVISDAYVQRVVMVPYDFRTIQEAINFAAPNSIILVSNGIYYEHIIVNKTLTLIGENNAHTIINGDGSGAVITIAADNVFVYGFKIMNSSCGICTNGFNNLTISSNAITSCNLGIYLFNSNTSVVSGNIIADALNNGVYSSNWNTFFGNSIVNSRIEFVFSGENRIHHNNFINSSVSENLLWSDNIWDDGVEGNFWDADAYYLDNYPLVSPYGPIPIIWDNVVYPVGLISNATIRTFRFIQPEKKISFYIQPSSTGYCNITIPKNLLTGNPWEISLTQIGTNVASNVIIAENQTCTSIHFVYTPHATYYPVWVTITGTWVVPEFSSSNILATIILVITILTIAAKNKKESWTRN